MSTNDTILQLLTVLNSVNPNPKHRAAWDKATPKRPKLNKKKVTIDTGSAPLHVVPSISTQQTEPSVPPEISVEDDTNEVPDDPYNVHFGPSTSLTTPETLKAIDSGKWTEKGSAREHLGAIIERVPEGASNPKTSSPVYVSRLKEAATNLGDKLDIAKQNTQLAFLRSISSYRDFFFNSLPLALSEEIRDAVSLHTVNHVLKIRRRVLKNNERISHVKADADPLEDVQDQGFTRPSILILLPFRSFALRWVTSLLSHFPEGTQCENHARFISEFGLPPGALDKVTSAQPGVYPPDHIAMMQGNVDDDFRVGLKITRKSIKLYSEFYSSDIILASPFGLRRAIEKDENADFLSSIEVLVIDQMDALAMQNWEHLQLSLSNLNQIPKQSRDTDFSRVKPWYLDGHSKYLRQSILLSPHTTPEMMNIYRMYCHNVSGQLRTRGKYSPATIPDGLRLAFSHFDCPTPQAEPNARFEHFTKRVFPAILKSAVQSSQTMIFASNYFDFVRIRHWLKQQPGVDSTVLFEESSNADISRARHAFFSGQKSFLLTTERFHFFRRYKIRGIRNIVFYALPEHENYVSEYLSFPFLDDHVDVSDVTVKVLWCRWDAYGGGRLERLVGSETVREMLSDS